MKIVVIGGTGTIGSAAAKELGARHDVIVAGHRHGDVQVDISSEDSIRKFYQAIGKIDAVIVTTGTVHFGSWADMKSADYQIGLQSKLMGQVNVVLLGLPHIKESGSFTLTSGMLSHYPIRQGSSAAMVNGAIDAFVKNAAIEMKHGIRINAVSPTVLTESMDKYAPYFRGVESVSAARVALAYSKSVEGAETGQVYRAGW